LTTCSSDPNSVLIITYAEGIRIPRGDPIRAPLFVLGNETYLSITLMGVKKKGAISWLP